MVGRRPEATAAGRVPLGLAGGVDRLAQRARARRHAARRHLHAGRQPRRDRHRGARGRQARALREAARELGRGRRADGGGRPRRRRAGRLRDGRLQLPAHARDRARQAARRAGPARRDPPDPRRLPAGLAERRRGADDVAPRQGARRLRRPRRHRRARHRPRAAPLRRHRLERQRHARDLRARAAPARRAARALGRRRHGARAGHRRRRGPLHGAVRPRPHRHLRGDPLRDRAEERVPTRVLRLRRRDRLRLRGPERAPVLRRHAAAGDARLPAHPGHRAGASMGRRLVAGRATDSATSTASSNEVARPRRRTSLRGGSRGRRSTTGCRCSGCSTRSSAAPRTAAHGPRSTRRTPRRGSGGWARERPKQALVVRGGWFGHEPVEATRSSSRSSRRTASRCGSRTPPRSMRTPTSWRPST